MGPGHDAARISEHEAARNREHEAAARFVKFVEDLPSGQCANNRGRAIFVTNAHPSRKLMVWLDRFHMGVPTADRSRSELAPGAPPEALGCSRSDTGPQEWRIVRARFVD